MAGRRKITIEEQIEEAKREIGLRRKTYPIMVERQRYTEAEAAGFIAAQEAIIASLEWLRDNRPTIMEVLEKQQERSK